MKAKGIRFVSISGNQYYQLRSFFPDIAHEMTFVGENGAYVVENSRVLKSHCLPLDTVSLVLNHLREAGLDHELVLCGERSAYICESVSQEAKDYFSFHNHRLEMLDSVNPLPDDGFMKFSFNTPNEHTLAIVDQLNSYLGHHVQAVSSGHCKRGEQGNSYGLLAEALGTD